MRSATVADTVSATHEVDHFDDLACSVRRRVAELGKSALFKARVERDLFSVYLDGFAPEERQHHNCNACRRFIERYGAVVAISADGSPLPLCWDPMIQEGHYAASVRALARTVTRAPIDSVFLDEATIWGSAPTPDAKRGVTWTHFNAQATMAPFKHPLHTASQAMAEKREEHGMLLRGLAEFPASVVEQARAMLETDSLYRSEKCLGVAKWLLDLHGRLTAVKNERLRVNLVWLAVATAPPGFCHLRSSMIGTLLEDIAAGLPFDAVRDRFAEKMNPLQYQRPQAPPSDGNIAQAEKIVETLRAAGALDRRFAKLVDIQALWLPPAARPAKPPPTGVFSHLRRAGQNASAPATVDAPAVVMTWVKFAREVMTRAERIEYLVPSRGNFAAFVTAANPDAPPILQWDAEGRRNRVSWYLYTGGSLATNWNLPACEPRRVTAIALQPPQWHDPDKFGHHGSGVLFALDGARDTRYTSGGGFFVESLRSEYHAVRRTIEYYAQRATISGRDEAEVCGVLLQKGGGWAGGHVFYVTSGSTRLQYRLDRWD